MSLSHKVSPERSPSIHAKSNFAKDENDGNKSSWYSFTSKEILETAQTLLRSGIPTSACSICEYVAGLICLRYAGKYGNIAELAGASLGFTWNSMFGIGIISSINQGFSVLAAQLYGAKKYRELGLLLQRNLFVLSLVLIPLLLSFYYADTMLLALGLDPEVAINTGIYLKNAIPSVLGLTVFECMRFFLIAQNYFYVQSVIQGGLSIVHIFWCHLFVVGYGMPVAGVGIAKSITDISCGIALWMYVKYKNICPESWIPWDRAALDNSWAYLKSTLVLGANLYVEWVSYEVSLLITTFLNNEHALGAHGVAITLFSSFYMLPLGNSYTMQAYMGNAVGEGSARKAQKFLFAGLGINAIMTLFNTIIMIGWNDSIAAFFTSDDETKTILQNIILIYGIGHVIDTCVSHLTGTLKVLGSEKQVLICFCFSYILVGINCEWIFGVALGYGYKAIWMSFVLGMCVMLVWALFKIVTLDWHQAIEKARERIEDYDVGEKNKGGDYVEMEEI